MGRFECARELTSHLHWHKNQGAGGGGGGGGGWEQLPTYSTVLADKSRIEPDACTFTSRGELRKHTFYITLLL